MHCKLIEADCALRMGVPSDCNKTFGFSGAHARATVDILHFGDEKAAKRAMVITRSLNQGS